MEGHLIKEKKQTKNYLFQLYRVNVQWAKLNDLPKNKFMTKDETLQWPYHVWVLKKLEEILLRTQKGK